MLILLNKPFRVLSQFTTDSEKLTLASFIDVPDVYPAGRLDYDSEGLILLTDDGRLQSLISSPGKRFRKHYWAQVEGEGGSSQCQQLRHGIRLKDGPAKALSAAPINQPSLLWPRHPPIRERKTVSDSWLDLAIDEGRNRQVRRMTAAVGLPCLRLIRYQVGPWQVHGLEPGESMTLSTQDAYAMLGDYQRH
ncbi:MAG: pseudouridine synthase [Woeseiaceae bacterium]